MSPAFALLRACAADASQDELARLAAGVPGAELVEEARLHGMLATLHVALRGVPLDPALAAELEGWYHRGLAGHMRATGEAVRACAALEAAGIPAVVAKGPVLAEAVYPRPDLRAYNDVDLFVPGADFRHALDVLEAAGCELLDRNWALIRRDLRGQLHARAPHGTELDVHWHLLNLPEVRGSLRIPMEELFGRRRRVSLGGPEVWTWDPADTLLTLALHAGLGGGTRLSWLRDVAQAAAVPLDWGEVAGRARAWGAGGLVGAVLRRTRRVLGAPIDERALRELGGSAAWRSMLGAAERLSPPERAPQRASLAVLLTNGTRDSLPASTAALASKLAPRRRGSVLADGGDDRDRDAYFRALAAAA